MTSNVSESKCYAGSKVLGRAVVTVHVLTGAGVTSYLLPHLVRHSPDGFNWGYLGKPGSSGLLKALLRGTRPQVAPLHAGRELRVPPPGGPSVIPVGGPA